MSGPLFLRRIHHKYVKLGRNRRKKGVWRAPKGRDNKLRDKRRGYSATVSVGYRRKSTDRKEIFVINNVEDLKKIGKQKEVFIGKVGKKKKLDILHKAKEMKVEFSNINAKKFLKKNGGIKKNESKQ